MTEKVVIGNATLYCGDCFDVAGLVERAAAVVIDPPYGIGFAAQPTKWRRRAGAEAEAWDDRSVARLPELLQFGGLQCVWGGNYYALPPSRGWLSWFKPDAPPSMASLELAWTNRDANARQITHSIGATNAERVGHPTQKPLAVMLWCLEQLGRPRSVIDWFMGSGTTGVAAMHVGASFVGVEVEPRYFDIACRRIEEAQKQAALFPHEPPAAQEQPGLFTEQATA